MGFRPIPRRKVAELEKTVPLSTLKEVMSPASAIADADTSLFGTALAVDIAGKFNDLLDELRLAGVLGRKTSKKEV